MSTRKDSRKSRTTPPSPMRFEDWIRQHVTQERLKRVETALEEKSLYPPPELFNFSNFGGLAEPVYRIHHDSFKALYLGSMATTCLEQLLYLFFGELVESTPWIVRSQEMAEPSPLKVAFLKHLRSRESNLYLYFMVVEKASKRLREWKGESLNIRKDSIRLLGAAVFWYVTLLACMEVSKKALADEKWGPIQMLTWDEAIVSYVAYWLSTECELR